jgi:spore coat protein CotH
MIHRKTLIAAVDDNHIAVFFHRRRLLLPLLPAISLLVCATAALRAADQPAFPQRPADLFQTETIWEAHFTFTPEEWNGLEPKGTGGPQMGGPPGRGFGPGMFLAPAFLKAGDADADSKLSANEFRALAVKWFAQWDKEKRGSINSDQLKSGLTESFPPPAPGANGAGAPGGPRPPGPPGLNLQGAQGKRNGLSSAAGIEFDYVNADLEFAGRKFNDVAVRYKGNGTFMQSRGAEKRSLKVDLNKFEKGQKIANITTLNFHNCITDASWMNEVLSYRLFRDAEVPAPRTAFARVYVTVPGKYERKYFGLYSLIENPDKNFAEELFGTKKGALFKPVTPQLFADLGDDWGAYAQTYDAKTDLKPAQKQRVIDFAKLVSHADDAAFAEKLGAFLDLDEFARFMSVTVWLVTLDSILGPGQNYYLYLNPQNEKFAFIPWDLDHSFGQFFLMGTQEQRESLNIHKPWRGENRFLDRVFKVDAFKKRYLEQMATFSHSIFKPERFHQQVDELAASLRPAVADESAEKLARFDKVVAGETPAPPSFPGGPVPPARLPGNPTTASKNDLPGNPPRFGGPGGFPPAIPPIKPFVVARARSVTDQLSGKSEGHTAGEFGPPRGGPGGGGPGGFGPGNFLARPFMTALDLDKNGELTSVECLQGFTKWFETWDGEKRGVIGEDQLRAGIERELFRRP